MDPVERAKEMRKHREAKVTRHTDWKKAEFLKKIYSKENGNGCTTLDLLRPYQSISLSPRTQQTIDKMKELEIATRVRLYPSVFLFLLVPPQHDPTLASHHTF